MYRKSVEISESPHQIEARSSCSGNQPTNKQTTTKKNFTLRGLIPFMEISSLWIYLTVEHHTLNCEYIKYNNKFVNCQHIFYFMMPFSQWDIERNQ